MRKTKKLFIFLTSVLCAVYFFSVVASSKLNVYAEEPVSDMTSQASDVVTTNEYQLYLQNMKKAHVEKEANENYYPEDVKIVLDYNALKNEDANASKVAIETYKNDENKKIDNYPTTTLTHVVEQKAEGNVEFTFDVSESGFYVIKVEYFTINGTGSPIERKFTINGNVPYSGSDALTFSRVWSDNPEHKPNGEFRKDTKENEIKPGQIEIFSYCSAYLKDYMGYTTEPFQFYFEKGENTIGFEVIKEPMVFYQISIESVPVVKTYAEYYEECKEANPSAKTSLPKEVIEAENSYRKSSPTLYPITDRSSSKTVPFSYTKSLLNTIGGTNWKVLGDWIEWQFTAPESGFYNITFRAKQNMVRGMYSSRIMYINGETWFEEMNNVVFAYNSKWEYLTLGNGEEAYKFYFEKDKTYTIRLEVTLGEYASLIERIQEVVAKLNSMYRSVISYTTVTPDKNRSYQLHERFPNLRNEIREYADELIDISNQMTKISGTKSDKTGVIDSVVVQLESFLEDYDLRTIPTTLNRFSNNISSLGSILNDLRELPLTLDEIIIHSPDEKLGKANEGFFRGLWDNIVAFFCSFFIDYSAISETESSKGDSDATKIEVWMTQGRDQANVIRNLIDTKFVQSMKEKGKNIKVELKLTAADVLLKATLAGIGPDVALNVDSTLPVNYALRNAVLDLSPFIYELDANGALVQANPLLYNADGTVKRNGTNALYLQAAKPVVKDIDFGFVWDGETYEEAVVRRYAEIKGFALREQNSDKTYEEIITDCKTGKDGFPRNFYMESSLKQFQFDFVSEIRSDNKQKDTRNGTTGTFALPEKQIFLMMFVRDDIMDEKGLNQVYDWDNMSWEDVIDLVATLQTDQLQFYLPVNDAGASALNPVFVTLLYQRQGRLYSNGNKETGLNSQAAMDAFEKWTEFYTLYSFPKAASFVNRFRSGEMPIGIAYYELYNTLSVFAPELKGRWSFHLIPGTRQEDGTIDHTATASGSGCVVLKQPAEESEAVKDAAWEFAKWWSSSEAQESFAKEMEGILGSAARHATANVRTLNSLAWPKKDIDILMSQWEQTCEISQIAGSYITGREVENAYRQVINNGYNPREVLFEYAEKIQKEINRKREEFGLQLRDQND